jgi:hypothetical protein
VVGSKDTPPGHGAFCSVPISSRIPKRGQMIASMESIGTYDEFLSRDGAGLVLIHGAEPALQRLQLVRLDLVVVHRVLGGGGK